MALITIRINSAACGHLHCERDWRPLRHWKRLQSIIIVCTLQPHRWWGERNPEVHHRTLVVNVPILVTIVQFSAPPYLLLFCWGPSQNTNTIQPLRNFRNYRNQFYYYFHHWQINENWTKRINLLYTAVCIHQYQNWSFSTTATSQKEKYNLLNHQNQTTQIAIN